MLGGLYVVWILEEVETQKHGAQVWFMYSYSLPYLLRILAARAECVLTVSTYTESRFKGRPIFLQLRSSVSPATPGSGSASYWEGIIPT